MDEQPEVNLHKHQSTKISNKYWLRMVMYAVILGLAYWWMQMGRKHQGEVKSGDGVEEVQFVEIEVE